MWSVEPEPRRLTTDSEHKLSFKELDVIRYIREYRGSERSRGYSRHYIHFDLI